MPSKVDRAVDGSAARDSPISPRPSVDLPQPDSPTSPSTSPGRSANETPSTARTGPAAPPAYQTRRSWTSRTVPLSGLTCRPALAFTGRQDDLGQLGVRSSGFSTSLSDSPTSVTPSTSSDDRETGVHAGPPEAVAHVVLHSRIEVVPPLGRGGRLDADTEEAQSGQGQDRVAGIERRDHRDGLHDVAEHVARHDRSGARPDRARGFDVGLLARRHRRVPDDAEVLRHVDHRDRHCGREDPGPLAAAAAADRDRDDDREQAATGTRTASPRRALRRGRTSRRSSRTAARAARRRRSTTATASTITSSAVCAPKITREYTSNPSTVVPNQCCADGAAWVGKILAPTPVWSNPYGAIHGANTARITMNSTRTRPKTRVPRWNPEVARIAATPGKRLRLTLRSWAARLSPSARVVVTGRLLLST